MRIEGPFVLHRKRGSWRHEWIVNESGSVVHSAFQCLVAQPITAPSRTLK